MHRTVHCCSASSNCVFPVDFSGFESVLIEHKTVTHMTGKFGRVRSISMLMVTGNKRGLAGFSLTTRPAKGGGFRSASNFQKAVDRAGMKLMQLHLFEGRTGRSYWVCITLKAERGPGNTLFLHFIFHVFKYSLSQKIITCRKRSRRSSLCIIFIQSL